MKQWIIFILAVSSSFCAAQEMNRTAPDYESIKTLIAQDDEHNYQKLLSRFQDADSTLTKEEYDLLYFGQYFQPDYHPYKTYNTELIKLYRENNIEEFIKQGEESLRKNPFDLRLNCCLMIAYEDLGDEINFDRVSRKFYAMVEAIGMSGDGNSSKTGFHVMNVSDEYVVLNILGFDSKSQRVVDSCDYHELEENDIDLKGIYFDVSKIFEASNKLFK
ncbi:DUF4919 domain-containing protein [Sphingobacterium hungaricum]